LVKQKKELDKAIVAVNKGMESGDLRIIGGSFYLGAELIKQGEIFSGAITLASKGMEREYASIQDNVLYLWEALFEKGQGLDEAKKLLPGITPIELYDAFEKLIEKTKTLVSQGREMPVAVAVTAS
jgi:hypothetical protein